jgi:putative peptidoglycan lipid II flippase
MVLGMVRQSILITLLALAASGLGFAVQLLLARRYGIGVDVDAYLFALSIPSFAAGLVSAMLSYQLVPRLITNVNTDTCQRRVVTTVLIGVVVAALAIGIVGCTMALFQGHLLPNTSPIRGHPQLVLLTLLSWATAVFQIIQGGLTAILTAHQRQLAGALLALCPNLGTLLVFYALQDIAGVAGLSLGLLAGTITATLIALFCLQRQFTVVNLRPALLDELRQLAYSSPYTALAMACFSAYSVVDAYWAPKAGEGALSTLGYSQRILITFGNLVAVGPSAVLVPKLARCIRDGQVREFKRLLLRSLLVVCGVSTGLALLIFFYATEIVALLLARGAFGTKANNVVAACLRNLTPGMVAMLMSVIVLRALFCLGDTAKGAALLGLGWVFGYFTISKPFLAYGAPGLALSYSLTWVLYFCVLTWYTITQIKR